MSKREKLRARLKNNRSNATFVVPVHNHKVKTIYVKRVIELVEQNNQNDEEE